MTPRLPLDTQPKRTGRYSGRTVLKPKNPFEPSSRLLLAAYRGSVSDFAVPLKGRRCGLPHLATDLLPMNGIRLLQKGAQ